jgi:hypothetical protein
LEEIGDHPLKRYLIMNPLNDDAFVELANEAARDATTPEDLQASLRERYPKAVVRPRLLEAEPHVVWYVYRDGRWVMSSEGTTE